MDYKSYENDINYFVSNLVYYRLKSKPDFTIARLAEQINVSVSFLNKAIASLEGKRFNVKHLFLIAKALDIEPNGLFPSKENYKLLTGKELSDDAWKQMIENYRNGKEKKDEP